MLAEGLLTDSAARNHLATQMIESDVQKLNLGWRLRYYKIELDWILVIFQELAKTESQPKDVAGQVKLLDKEHWPNDMLVQVHDSHVRISPRTADFTADLSPEGVALSFPSTSTSQNGTDYLALSSPVAHPANYPVEISSEPSSNVPEDVSPIASSPSPATVFSLVCEICRKVFKGARDSRTNLRRHIIQFHYGGIWKHKCEVPGCGTICARSDYLQKHRQKVHKLPPIRKIIRKRNRKPDSGQGQ